MSTALVPAYIAAGRFTTESDTNHSGSIWISTLICITYSSIILLIRGHLRWSVLGVDDYLAIVATVLQAAEVGTTIAALQHGLGQSQTLLAASQLKAMNASLFASRLLFVASICAAKLSVILLIMRLFNLNGVRSKADRRTRNMWIICWATAAFVVVWGVASVISLSVECSISELTTQELAETCPSQTARWAVISAFDGLTEIVLVLLSILIVWPVQLRLSMKVPIVLAFSFRLPCAILAVLHSYYVHRYADVSHSTWPFPPLSATNPPNPSPDPGLALVPAVVLMQIELCWSLISTTIPTLKSFVRSFNSGCGLGLDLDDFMSTNRYGSSSLSRRGTENDANNNSVSSPTTDLGPGATGLKRLSSLMSTTNRQSRNLEHHDDKNTSRFDRELEKLDPISTVSHRYSSHHAAVSSPVTAGSSAATSNRNSTINCWKEPTSEEDGSWGFDAGTGTGMGIGSRDNIIRKDMHYSVHYEPKE